MLVNYSSVTDPKREKKQSEFHLLGLPRLFGAPQRLRATESVRRPALWANAFYIKVI